jgi:putative copper export protein
MAGIRSIKKRNMDLYQIALILHVTGASIWVGGHLVLCLRYLPQALKKRDPSIIQGFEKHFEPVGIPALLVQVITGIWMAFDYYGLSFLSFSNPMSRTVSIKLILLLFTLVLAIHARFYIIPKLNERRLNQMALHIIFITVTGLAMMILGVRFRLGGV